MRVLITSGGGAKGAFSVGVLRYLKEHQGIDSFDFISGTSTGALIASIASIGRFDQLANIYLNTTNDGVLMPQNVIDSLVNGDPFIFNTDPLLEQIERNIDAATFDEIMTSSTTLCFNAVSLQTGKVTVFATKEITPAAHYETKIITDRRMLINALLGSSNQAVFLNPIRIGNEDYVDGGNRETVPTRVVVENLNTREDHEIFILSNNPNNLLELPGKKFTSLLDVLMRAIAMFVQEVRENDLEVMAKYKTFYDINKIAPNLKIKIYYFCPPFDLDPQFSTGLRFERGRMLEWMAAGRRIADEIFQTSPDGNFPMFHPSDMPIV
jgi:predicted acylesterase/phospholipase RssA